MMPWLTAAALEFCSAASEPARSISVSVADVASRNCIVPPRVLSPPPRSHQGVIRESLGNQSIPSRLAAQGLVVWRGCARAWWRGLGVGGVGDARSLSERRGREVDEASAIDSEAHDHVSVTTHHVYSWRA